jgi:hypothetical protein
MSRVSSKEAAQLVRLLEATPEVQRSEAWPPLLTLLTRWAAQGAVGPPPSDLQLHGACLVTASPMALPYLIMCRLRVYPTACL